MSELGGEQQGEGGEEEDKGEERGILDKEGVEVEGVTKQEKGLRVGLKKEDEEEESK